MSEPFDWHLRGRVLRLGRPHVMGIVNVTPDSFSDGGRFLGIEPAVAHALELVRQGADLLDIGGESSRPGAAPVGVEEELARVVPVIGELALQTDVPLSLDTCKPAVARAGLEAGAHLINDITALADPALAEVVREFGAGVILMHMQGTPATMQVNPHYEDVVAEVAGFLEARLRAAADLGIAERQVVLDPGIGFGKTVEHNLELVAYLEVLGRLGRPVCLGVSRKGFLGAVVGRPRSEDVAQERLAAALACACFAVARRSAQVLRVHDVGPTRDAVLVLEALMRTEGEPGA